MAEDEDNVDLAAREAAQQKEKATQDAEEKALRNAQLVYEEERDRSTTKSYQVAKMNEDPNSHLMDFEEIMNTFQYNGVSQDAVYLRTFPFTLKDDAKHWLRSLPNGLNRTTLSNAAGGSLMKKTLEEIVTILDELSEDANHWPSEIAERRRSTGVHQSENHTACDICGRGHPTHECQASTEEVNAVGNYNFNEMGQKHPQCFVEFTWANVNAWQQNNPRFQGQGAPGFVNQPRPQFQPQHSTQPGLEDLNMSFIIKTDERLNAHGSAIKELGTSLRNLKKQVGQIATILSERIPDTLPANTEINPKEMVNVVTLRSGKVLKDPAPIQQESVPEKEVEEQLKNEVDKKKKGKKGAEKNKETSRREESNESEHIPALPFLQKLYREKLDKQFEKFLGILRQVNVNLPFTEVLSQMPAYARFLKEILTNKRKIEETSVVKIIEHCSAILQNKLPQKKLENELGEIRSAPISLELADQTTIIPEGIVENVLVRVDKFVFPVDFIVVKMEENKEVPLILGIPFLATGREILDIHDRKLMLRVGDETVTFEMNVEMG
ncbi:uncharacterized protein [Nicotiana tomentosiformis]|uniref:uncharacterized protein n=1 Tax=Nicotiana tomentosiformis TaxID=4098 RepID=UPI00388C9CB9